jgi:hypothetical protein
VGFADPENGVGFAYVMNQMEPGVLPNQKSLGLIDAVYRELPEKRSYPLGRSRI